MSDFLTLLTTLFTQFWVWISTACENIIQEPLLIFSIGLMVVGAVVGLVKRFSSGY